ncbi:UNVERIFIED_CONTAM: hypothetical protein PYX00_004603 [Menopon gallinae]|uniref:Uncharacterized protein n=1 Tax=Menopon gallinae TaxID=328185 RepID=A0AAW2I4D5_9NEOP
MKVLLSILLLTVLQFLMTEGKNVSEIAMQEAGNCPPGFVAGEIGKCILESEEPGTALRSVKCMKHWKLNKYGVCMLDFRSFFKS